MWPPLLELLEELVAMIIFWGMLVLGAAVLGAMLYLLSELVS
jgi:hypothetical protein